MGHSVFSISGWRGGVAMLAVLAACGVGAMSAQDPAMARPRADTVALSVVDAQRLALLHNPDLRAARQEIPIARGQLRQATTLRFNPEVAAAAPGVASSGSIGEYDVSLTQELEWAGQRGLRSGAARLGLDRATSSVRNANRLTLGDVSLAFFEALAAQRRLAVVTTVTELNQRLLEATRAQLREGEISSLESNLAEIEFGRAKAAVLATRRMANSTALELKRLLGMPLDQPIALRDEVASFPVATALALDSLLAAAMRRRPDLAADSVAVAEFEMLRRLASREAMPNLRVGVIADRDRVGDPARLGLGVGWTFPIWNRNRGLIAQRDAEREQAVLRHIATEERIRSQVLDAYAAYVAASEEAGVYESSVLQPARTNQDLLETAYRAGKVNLPTMLLLRNQLLAAELGYWDAWLARRTALIALQTATAGLTPASASPTNDDTGINP